MADVFDKTTWRDAVGFDKILPIVLGSILAIGTSYFATRFQTSSQLRLQKVEEQRAVFARITGRKFTTTQLYQSRYEAIIFSDFHEERWRRAGFPKDSVDQQEDFRWMHRSEDLVTDIIKNNQGLFEDLATTRALFPDTPRLRDLCDRIYRFHSLWTQKPPQNGSADDLVKWKNEAENQLQIIVEREYGRPIDELEEFLVTQLPTE
jgi:hypothetical protein